MKKSVFDASFRRENCLSKQGDCIEQEQPSILADGSIGEKLSVNRGKKISDMLEQQEMKHRILTGGSLDGRMMVSILSDLGNVYS